MITGTDPCKLLQESCNVFYCISGEFCCMEKKGTSTRKKVRAVPKGMHTVTPFLLVENAAGFIKFLKNGFGGEQTYIMKAEGKVMHATVKIGDSILMVADVMEPQHPMPAQFYLYVEDMDMVYKKALKAGATSLREPLDEFYGDRSGAVRDEWGNHWWIATHTEDVSEEEIRKREKEFRKQQQAGKTATAGSR
jgi:PhnB protein